MICIEEKDFRLIPVSETSELFDLEVLYIVNKGKENERIEFRNVAYGIPLESAIKRIATYRVNNKLGDDPVGLRVYLEAYKDIIKEINELCNV